VCLLLGCFTCGVTYWAAVPFALVGGVVGFFGHGNMRVAGLVLNLLALIPATIVLVMFLGMAGLAGTGATVRPQYPDRMAAAPDQIPMKSDPGMSRGDTQNQRTAYNYLVDMKAELISAYEFNKDREVKVNGVKSTRSLFLHPPANGFSVATYALDKKYARFKATVGINDGANGGAGSKTPLMFAVYLDGKDAWRSQPVQKCGETQECDIGVAGAGRLELRVNCPGDAYCAHAVWLEPIVVSTDRGNGDAATGAKGKAKPADTSEAEVRRLFEQRVRTDKEQYAKALARYEADLTRFNEARKEYQTREAQYAARYEDYEAQSLLYASEVALQSARRVCDSYRTAILSARAARNTSEVERLTNLFNGRYEEVIRKFPDTQAEADARALRKGDKLAQRPLPTKPVAPERPVAPTKPIPPPPPTPPEQILAEVKRERDEAERPAKKVDPRPNVPSTIRYLDVYDFAVGAVGYPSTDVKIIQIMDDNRMLVRLRDRRTLESSIIVMLKCPTRGHTDGEYFGIWDELIGKGSRVRVSDAIRYNTAGGGTKTVFLVEVFK
jgi:hypothetical protein